SAGSSRRVRTNDEDRRIMEEAFHTGRYGAGPPGRTRPHRTGRRGPAVRTAGRQPGWAAGRPTAARRYPGGMHRRAQRRPDVAGAEGSAPRATSRRQLLRGAGAAAALGAVGTVGAGAFAATRLAQPEIDPRTVVSLWSGTVAYDSRGTRRPVGGRGDRLELGPGTRLAADLPETSAERRRSAGFDDGTAAWRDRLTDSL